MDGDRPDRAPLVTGSGIKGLPVFSVSGDDGNRVLRVEYIRRKDIGLNYVPKVSSTLDPASFVPMSGEETVQAVDAWRERVIREQAAEPGVTRLFGVVEVGGPDPKDTLRD